MTHLISAETRFQSILVHHKVKQDLIRLIEAAYCEGFELEVASGFRDFNRQRLIWNNKFSGKVPILDKHSKPLNTTLLDDNTKINAIMRWSALPGASRHHWGTDFDVYAKNEVPIDAKLKLEPWEYLTGHQVKFHQWLKNSAAQYGFFFPYAKDRGGVAAEPWHISHRSSSSECLSSLTVDIVKSVLTKESIKGLPSVIQQLETLYTQYIINICPE